MTGATAGEESVLDLVARQCIPFPRLHFFTLATSMGQQLEANEILVPAVTVSSNGNRITPDQFPDDRFSPKDRWPRFFLPGPGPEYTPTLERIIPGNASASLIAPSMLIRNIIKGACKTWTGAVPDAGDGDESCEEGPSFGFESIFGDNFGGHEDVEMAEAESNCNDLVSEYQQYADDVPVKTPLK